MRVAIAIWPQSSHLYPLAPMAWALQNAGHEVRVVSHPDLAGTVMAAGLVPVSLGGHAERRPVVSFSEAELDSFGESLLLEPGEEPLWSYFRHRVLPLLATHYPGREPDGEQRGMVDDLVDHFRAWRPDLVLWDPAFLAAPVAARACGAAHGRLLWGLDYLGWMWSASRKPARRDARWDGADPLTALIAPMAERFGQQAEDELFLGQWTVDPMPPRMRLPLDIRSMPVRAVPYQQSAELPRWLHGPAPRRRICLTAGMFSKERRIGSGVSFHEAVDALAQLDAEIVATVDADRFERGRALPDNLRLVDYVPFSQLLPTCAAVVHHGGFGTFNCAVAHRVPQMISDAFSLQDSGVSRATATYVTGRGAGISLDQADFTPESLAAGLTELISEVSYARGAEELYRDALAVPGPGEIVPSLVELAHRHRG